jgi:hypothetical protein
MIKENNDYEYNSHISYKENSLSLPKLTSRMRKDTPQASFGNLIVIKLIRFRRKWRIERLLLEKREIRKV